MLALRNATHYPYMVWEDIQRTILQSYPSRRRNTAQQSWLRPLTLSALSRLSYTVCPWRTFTWEQETVVNKCDFEMTFIGQEYTGNSGSINKQKWPLHIELMLTYRLSMLWQNFQQTRTSIQCWDHFSPKQYCYILVLTTTKLS